MTDTAVRAVLAQAAVCESFDAKMLVATITDPAQQRAALQQLAQDCIEIERDGGFRWTMVQSARERTLAGLEREEFERALASQPNDILARQIAAVLARSRDGAGSEPFLYRALELLRLAQDQGAAIPRADLESRSRETRANLDRQSATDALQGTVRGPLRGRAAPLQFLRAFARGGARAIEAQHNDPVGAELHRANLPQRRWPDVPALLVSGSGGIGKSALIAELIRTERGPRWNKRIVVHFDFDEPALRAGDQGAMLLEFARQIALARPALDAGMSDSRKRLRAGLLAIERIPTGAFEQAKFLIHTELSRWRPLLAEQGVEEVLLILDTLEEVTAIDFKRLDALFGWLDSLRQDGGLHRLHVIGSGRALVPDGERAQLWPYFLAELELRDLSARAARAMLRDRLVRDKREAHVELVWRCIEVFGGNPLVLSILARYCVDNDVAALEALLADAQSDEGRRRFGIAAQQFLYGRILERVRDEAIRPLVYPGLVLRRVTPALICDVLAGPCGLGAIDAAQAEILLRRLQLLAWLVTPDGDGLRHRRDVRRQMLPLILEREPDRAAAVSRAAAQWYAINAAPGVHDAGMLESWYHRGLLGELSSIQETDMRALSVHLGEDVEDLPSNVRSLVKFAVGRSLTQAEHSALPAALKDIVSMRQAHILRREGLDNSALRKVSAKPVAVTSPVRLQEQIDGGASPNGHGILESLPSAKPIISPVGRVASGHHAVTDPELVKVWFAAGEFEQVAGQLPALLVDYWRRLQHRESLTTELADEPAYLAAVAARAFSPAPVDWVGLIGQDVVRVEREVAAIYGRAPAILAIEALLFSAPDSPTLSSLLGIPELGIALAKPFLHTLKTAPNAWQSVLAGAMQARTNRPQVVPLPLVAFPFLHADLQDFLVTIGARSKESFSQIPREVESGEIVASWNRRLGARGRAVGWHSVLRPIYDADRIAHEIRSLPDSSAKWDLSGIDQLAHALTVIAVSFDLTTARGSGFRPIGLVPELYASVRSAFQAELQPAAIAALVEKVTEPLLRWPDELRPNSFAMGTTDRSNELLPLLLTVADYHGCLGTLVRAAADAHPDAYRIGRVRKLFDAFEAAWAL